MPFQERHMPILTGTSHFGNGTSRFGLGHPGTSRFGNGTSRFGPGHPVLDRDIPGHPVLEMGHPVLETVHPRTRFWSSPFVDFFSMTNPLTRYNI